MKKNQKSAPKFQVGDKIWYVWGEEFLTDPKNWEPKNTICTGTIYEIGWPDKEGVNYYVQPGVRMTGENSIFPTKQEAEKHVAARIKEKIVGLQIAGTKLGCDFFSKKA